MGDYNKAPYAYMIPLQGEGGTFKDDNPMTHTLCIYMIPVDGVAKFKRAFGKEWGVLYNMTDSTGLDMFKENDEDTGKR